MKKKNDGGNAFPTITENTYQGVNYLEYSEGMSLRDYFATHVLNNIEVPTDSASIYNYDVLAKRKYLLADAMIKARES